MAQILETRRDSFTISNDPARLDMDAICDLLSRTYWANTRPREKTELGVVNSLTFGVYDGVKQIGVARIITDYSIAAYLCDVVIHEDYRGRGLGKWLVETIFNHPDLIEVRRWLLATDDAKGLYERHGFVQLPEAEKWMQKFRPFKGE
jgi:GNAT superfamily N-acetyltransferase